MGVDGVRVTVSWKFVSGESKGRPRRRPPRLRGKRAEDPRNFRSDIWDRFDDIVRLAQANGITVLSQPHRARAGMGSGPRPPKPPLRPARRGSPARPRSASSSSRSGRRYSGTWVDENQDHSVLPRVVVWSISNEPDQPASLSPQIEFDRKLHRQIPVAPILYREIYYAATAALRRPATATT